MASRLYRLEVEGELSDRMCRAFVGMTFSHENQHTVLVGPVRDQAELQGLLRRVSEFGLTLISATVTEAATASTQRAQAARPSGAAASDD